MMSESIALMEVAKGQWVNVLLLSGVTVGTSTIEYHMAGGKTLVVHFDDPAETEDGFNKFKRALQRIQG